MRKVFYIILVLLYGSFNIFGQEISYPENYTVIDSVSGNLDSDGRKELAVVFNTVTYDDNNIPREIIIYRKENGKWVTWKRSRQVVYGSKEGGLMGDPFRKIEIINGILRIIHEGGSSWKWTHTDEYQFKEDEFYLIRFTSIYGKLCEYWEKADLNLITGKMIVEKEFDNCEASGNGSLKNQNEIFYKKGIKLGFENRRKKDIKIVTPKYGNEIYLALKFE